MAVLKIPTTIEQPILKLILGSVVLALHAQKLPWRCLKHEGGPGGGRESWSLLDNVQNESILSQDDLLIDTHKYELINSLTYIPTNTEHGTHLLIPPNTELVTKLHIPKHTKLRNLLHLSPNMAQVKGRT